MLTITGKINLLETTCIKCHCKIYGIKEPEKVKCANCGATYELTHTEAQAQQIFYEYDFIGFKCLHRDYLNFCDNLCPAPEMYCREHSEQKDIDKAEQTIKHIETRLDDAQRDLDRIEESKKTWIISDLSGVSIE